MTETPRLGAAELVTAADEEAHLVTVLARAEISEIMDVSMETDSEAGANDEAEEDVMAEQSAHQRRAPPEKAADREGAKISAVDMAKYSELLNSDNAAALLEAIKFFRRALSAHDRPPTIGKQIVEAGLLPRIVGLLDVGDDLVLWFEAAWVLTNIASGDADDTHAVMASGGVERCLDFITPPGSVSAVGDIDMEVEGGDLALKGDSMDWQGELCAQCMWLVGNAASVVHFRDSVIALGAVDRFTTLLHSWIDAKGYQCLDWLRCATWAATNLVSGRPHPAADAVEPLLKVFARLIDAKDSEVATDAAWGLAHLADIKDLLPLIVDVVLEKVKEDGGGEVETLLVASRKAYESNPKGLTVPLMRMWGNLVRRSTEGTGAVVDAGIVPILLTIASTDKKDKNRKEAWWALSNVASRGPDHIRSLIDAGVVDHLLRSLESEEDCYSVFKEVLFVFGNICDGAFEGKQDVMAELLETGVVQAVVAPIVLRDEKLCKIFADSFLSLLKAVAEDEDVMERVLDILHPFVAKLEERNVEWCSHSVNELVIRAT